MKITIENLTAKIESIKNADRVLLPYHPEYVDGLISAYQDVLDCLIEEAREQMDEARFEVAQEFVKKLNS
jgi:hypothetical protein